LRRMFPPAACKHNAPNEGAGPAGGALPEKSSVKVGYRGGGGRNARGAAGMQRRHASIMASPRMGFRVAVAVARDAKK
jgi:hypothetical protein